MVRTDRNNFSVTLGWLPKPEQKERQLQNATTQQKLFFRVADRQVADPLVTDRLVADRLVADPLVADRLVTDRLVADRP